MAKVTLADIYEATEFHADIDQAATERNVFLNSGVLQNDSVIDEMASTPSRIGELPFFNALADEEPDYTDDSENDSVPSKITGGKQIFRSALMHKSWATKDVTRELGLKDPYTAIVNKIGQYWATQYQKRVIQSCVGILNDNVANDSGDMVVNVATDGAGAITDAERLTATTLLDAKQKKGDAADVLDSIAVHSVIKTQWQKNNLITTVPDSEGNINFELYLNKYRIVMDDGMPAVQGANRITYTSILFAQGSIAWGNGNPTVPGEIERNPSSGMGGGEDIIHVRQTKIIHPYGFQFLSASVAGESATLAELATAGNWDRQFDNKNIGLVFIKTNG